MRIPYAKRIVFKEGAQKTTQGKKPLTMQVLHGCTFFLCQTHIRAEDTKIGKKKKSSKKSKKPSKSDIAQNGPQSGTKQSIWRGSFLNKVVGVMTCRAMAHEKTVSVAGVTDEIDKKSRCVPYYGRRSRSSYAVEKVGLQ